MVEVAAKVARVDVSGVADAGALCRLRNQEREAGRIIRFLKRYSKKNGITKFVLGVSGGIDSATVLFILARAFRKEQIFPILLPESGVTPKTDLDDAKAILKTVGLVKRARVIQIDPIVSAIRKKARPKNKTALANIRSRVRMILLYSVANSLKNAIVVGTGDRSEELIGYFTKYGDGGIDINPIVHLYKTQVVDLARHLGVLECVCSKPPSPGLVPGQNAKAELGADYNVIDQVLFYSIDKGFSRARVAALSGTSGKFVTQILKRVKATEHKRNQPLGVSI